MDEFVRQQVHAYLERAHRALRTGYLALDDQDYIAAVNRAYYAIFYAANALLATKGLERSKHSGAIAAFSILSRRDSSKPNIATCTARR
mgnify:CR=1 FL=1